MRYLTICLMLLVAAFPLGAQEILGFALAPAPSTGRPSSNSASVVSTSGDTIWFGTSRGLDLTADGGLSWEHFANTATFTDKGISALAVMGDTICAAIGYNTNYGTDVVATGGGLHISTDRGATWQFVPQPVDSGTVDTLTYGINKIPALAITVSQQNITYDIALTPSTIWIASFAGMLRKSTDLGQSWQRVILPPDGPIDWITPTDTLDFDLSPAGGSLGLQENLNHRVFSVFASDDSTLWVGTAGGINKSTDGGVSWRKYNHQNQASPVSGNFVVAINGQRMGSERIVWAATVNAVDPDEEQGVSFTEDGGATWKTTLLGERAYNIAFKDSIIYVASGRGLFRSDDRGQSWLLSGTIADPSIDQRFTTSTLYCVGVSGDTVWVGGPDGIAYTVDRPGRLFGEEWHVFRTFQPVAGTDNVYAYPNPFSPDDEVTRIHFSTDGQNVSVTIRIFDFAMLPVRTLLQHAPRSGTSEHDEVWNGKDSEGRRVANGVYFYSVEMDSRPALWGKVLVLQ